MAATPERKLAAIMVADIAGFSSLMERDESATFERIKTLRDTLITPKVAEHGGRVIKTTGDGFLAEFPSATAALQCGISIQRHNQSREEALPAEDRIHMRIGINVGDIIIDGTDVAGDGVVIAARLEPLAPRDGICVSATVREHIRQELGIEYEDLGDQHVKNITRPIRAYRIALAGKDSVDTKGARIVKATKQRMPKKAILFGAAAVVIAMVTVAAMYAGVIPWRSPAGATAASAQDAHMTFAILPLTAAEGDAQAAAFAATVTDGMIARQANSVWSKIVSRESVEAAQKKHSSPRELGHALNVRYLVRGRVTRNADTFVANLSVLEAESERVLGARDMPWPASKPFDMNRSVADDAIGYLAGRAYRVELDQAKLRKDEDRDVRELVSLARDAWNNDKASYEKSMAYLKRAMAKAPDDRALLSVLTSVNLCECRTKWSANPGEQEKIGADAVDRYLAKHPPIRSMVMWKVYLHSINGRHDDALVIVDGLLDKSPGDPELLSEKAYQLLRAGRAKEALAAIQSAVREDPSIMNRFRAAAVHFVLGNYAESAEYAQKAAAEMDKDERKEAFLSSVFLIRAGANASLGRAPQAKAALQDFNSAVPEVRTISQMRKWIDPRADIAGYEPLFVALRKAGVPD